MVSIVWHLLDHKWETQFNFLQLLQSNSKQTNKKIPNATSKLLQHFYYYYCYYYFDQEHITAVAFYYILHFIFFLSS